MSIESKVQRIFSDKKLYMPSVLFLSCTKLLCEAIVCEQTLHFYVVLSLSEIFF
jgi:hypothetical protein